MKKITSIVIILAIIIVSTLRVCKSGDDAVSEKTEKKALPPIDKALQIRTDSFITNQQHVGSLGLMVYDMTAQKEVYTMNADKPMRPASCMKLLTCVATLRKVGTKYNYKTRLYYSGSIVKDTLHGDIILKTQFDPFFNRDSLNVLTAALKSKNIKAVKGHVILDMAFTEPMDHEQHWTMGDLKVSRMGLIYHGFKKMRTETLYSLQNIAGIRTNIDSIRFGRLNTRKVVLIAETKTPILFPVEKALKNSSNINAESLLYLLGYTVNRNGDFRKNGIIALQRFVRDELKTNPQKACNIEDGCGLCPDDQLSPKLLVSILEYAYHRPKIYDAVFTLLPMSGTDGTLHDRLRKPNVAGMIKAKTGTLTREGGISTLAGYFKGNDGHLMAFSIMNNECPVMDGRWWQDRFCEKVFFPKKNTSPKTKTAQ